MDQARKLEQKTEPSSIRAAAIRRGKKLVLIVFIIWAAQAIPTWTAAILADGEMSARIMKVFVAPSDSISAP